MRPTVVDVLIVRRVRGHWRILLLQRADEARSAGAWEIVHGRVEPDESPVDAALREVREETGLELARLYTVRAHQFYVAPADQVHLAVAFCGFVEGPGLVRLGPEHRDAAWVAAAEAARRCAWPSEATTLADARRLLGPGHAGAQEAVLRVR